MIDRANLGRTWPSWTVEVERGRLRLLAKALGETRPVYLDDTAARQAGYRSILAPLTFPHCLLTDDPAGLHYLTELGIPTERMLHAEWQLTPLAPICAGDRIRVTRRVADLVVKKGGALEFVTFDCEFANAADDSPVARVRTVLAIRWPT